jgi:hypothetical protein
MNAPQKTGWDEHGEYHGPFTEVTTFPCPVAGPCPCGRPCKMMVKTLLMAPFLDLEALRTLPASGVVQPKTAALVQGMAEEIRL